MAVICSRLLLVLACITALSGCSSQKRPARKAKPAIGIPGVTAENYPWVNGSTSTGPLGALLAAHALGLNADMRMVTFHEPRAMVTFPLGCDAERLDTYARLGQSRHHIGTHEAYMSLLAPTPKPPVSKPASAEPTPGVAYHGPTDLILVAREPSEDELGFAKKAKIEMEVRPVALDAFVFLNNAESPIRSLTLDQVRGIYSGKITNWRDLGGPDRLITAYTRNPNSGSQELMEKLVMKGEKMIAVRSGVLYGMMDVIERVHTDSSAIAYSVYYYEHTMARRPENRLIAIEGVLPTPQTIADRSYPLVSEVYVVTRKGIDPHSPAAKLRDWLLSDEGQKLVKASGYVPIRRS